MFMFIINVVCCVGSVQIQIKIEKGWFTVGIESKVQFSDEGLTLKTL